MLVRAFVIFTVACAALCACASAPADAAVPAVILPLTGSQAVVYDAAHGHIFVTGWPADSVIAVQSPDGFPVATIPDESAAGGMALVGNTLYVARCGLGQIDEIDTATLEKIGSFAADPGGTSGADTCNLAYAGGRLWYSVAPENGFGHLESVSLDSSHTQIDTGINFSSGLNFGTTPAHPSWLLVVGGGPGSGAATLYDVSNPSSPQTLGSTTGLGEAVAFNPDASQLLATADNNTAVGYTTPGFGAGTSYTLPEAPGQLPFYEIGSVAFSPSGSLVAVGASTTTLSGPGSQVSLFDTGASTPSFTWPLAGATIDPGQRNLTFEDDNSLIGVGGEPGLADGTYINVFSTKPAGTVTLTAAAPSVSYGKTDLLTAHLGTASSDRSISIYRIPRVDYVTFKPPVLVVSGTVGPLGNLAFLAKPSTDATYIAVWEGDGTHAATASSNVSVQALPILTESMIGGYQTLHGYREYHYAKSCVGAAHTGCPTFQLRVAPGQPGVAVTVQLEEFYDHGWHLVLQDKPKLGPKSGIELTFFYRSTAIENIGTRVRAVYASNLDYGAVTAPWTYFRVTS